MQTAQGAAYRIERSAALRNGRIERVGFEFLPTERASEVAALVVAWLELDQMDARKR